MIAAAVLEYIPSPHQGVWHVFGLPVRGYALCIIAGVVAACWLGNRRYVARGGEPGRVVDVALIAVPVGLIGARLYHVITDHSLYFSHGHGPDQDWNPLGALEIWHGGLGIWGGIAGGALGAWLACRHYGLKLAPLADALAPALLLAQAIGRWGNYFNQELFGRPTRLPWGLRIDTAHLPDGFDASKAFPEGPPYTFHPTFLYECLWNLGGMALLIWLDRRLKLGFGRCFALYMMVYCAGRFWIEELRIDRAADGVHLLGLRFNAWTSIAVFLAGLVLFVVQGRRHPKPDTRETFVARNDMGSGRRADVG